MALTIRANGDTTTSSWFNDIKTELEAVAETTSDDFAIGDGTDTNKTLTAANGDANEPQLRYNASGNEWEYSDNGTVYTALNAGTVNFTTVTKSSSDTLSVSGEDVVLGDATSGNVVLTLPAASGNSGLIYRIQKIDASANYVELDGNASETIDGLTTTRLYGRYSSIQIACDGTSWYSISDKTPQTCYVNVHATKYYYFVAATSNYKTSAMTSLEGDSDFAAVSSNQLILQPGSYELEIPTGGYNGPSDVVLGFYDITNTAYIIEKAVVYSVAGDRVIDTVKLNLDITAATTYEVRTKSGGVGEEITGKIKVIKRK